jgi:AAA domain/Primase C terminal 1 (PriCT-1)
VTATATDPMLAGLEFIAGLYEPGDIVEFRCIKKGKPVKQCWCHADEVGTQIKELFEFNGVEFNIYFGVNPRRVMEKSGDANVLLARCVFADFDEELSEDEVLRRIEAAHLPTPSFLVFSGHGWHAYWILDEPITDLTIWSDYQKRLAALLGSDAIVHNRERIMRLPGTTNWKESPVHCRLVAWEGERYQWADILPLISTLSGSNGDGKPHAEPLGNEISDGKRNATLASLAGTMRKRGANQQTIEAALLAANRSQCRPPLDDVEVRAIAESVSRYSPGDSGQNLVAPTRPIVPITGASLVANGPELNEPIVDGIWRIGEIVNIISGSKSYKTYFLIALLLCIAAGRSWLGFTTRRVRVLLIDNELHLGTLKHRIKSVASALGINMDDLGDYFQVVALRGHLQNIQQMRGFFAGLKAGHYGVIALDSWYRMIPAGVDENSNSEMTLLYNLLDEFAAMLLASILLIHHSTKGRQGDKQVTDVGAGAGAMSRAADCHLILRAHRLADCAILQSAIRSFAPMTPLGLKWTYPTWSAVAELDVTDLQRDTRRKAAPKPEKIPAKIWTVEEFVATAIAKEARPKPLILAKAVQAGITNRRAAELLLLAEESKLAFRHRGKDAREVFFASVEPSVSDVPTPSNGDIYHARTAPQTPRVRKRTGGSVRARAK